MLAALLHAPSGRITSYNEAAQRSRMEGGKCGYQSRDTVAQDGPLQEQTANTNRDWFAWFLAARKNSHFLFIRLRMATLCLHVSEFWTYCQSSAEAHITSPAVTQPWADGSGPGPAPRLACVSGSAPGPAKTSVYLILAIFDQNM